MAIQRSQLVQEVRELTDMFRTEDTFANVRAMLQRHSISPTDVLLAGLIESADWYECGAVVLPDQRAFLFECEDSRTETFDRAEFVPPDSLTERFPAILVAVDLASP